MRQSLFGKPFGNIMYFKVHNKTKDINNWGFVRMRKYEDTIYIRPQRRR